MSDTEVDLSETNGATLVGTAAVFLVLSWITVVLRIYTRAYLTKSMLVDDWLMLIGLAVFTMYASFLFAAVGTGLGRHNAAIEDDATEVAAIKFQALAIGVYIIDMMFIKLSIGFFLLRIAIKSIYVWILRVSLVIITIWSTVIFFWNIFQCSPVEKQWDYRIQYGQCVELSQLVSAAYALSAMSIVSDFLYALLPIPMLWNVKMSKQAKMTVILILGMGILASVATIVRIRYLPAMMEFDDILFAGTPSMTWTIVEPGLAIVASSLATIRPLLRAMRIRGFESEDVHDPNVRRSGKAKQALPSSSTPSYGLDEMTLPDNASVYIGQDQQQLDSDSISRQQTWVDDKAAISSENQGGNQSVSEVYVIEGPSSGRSWSCKSDTISMVQIHDLEAQSQDGGRLRLGLESDRSGS